MLFLLITGIEELVVKGEISIEKPKIGYEIPCKIEDLYIMNFYGIYPQQDLKEMAELCELLESLKSPGTKPYIEKLIKNEKESIDTIKGEKWQLGVIKKLNGYLKEGFKLKDFMMYYYGVKTQDALLEKIFKDTSLAGEMFRKFMEGAHSTVYENTLNKLNSPFEGKEKEIYKPIQIMLEVEGLIKKDSLFKAERMLREFSKDFPLFEKVFAYPSFLYALLFRKLNVSYFKEYERVLKKKRDLYLYYAWLNLKGTPEQSNFEKISTKKEMAKLLEIKNFICKNERKYAESLLRDINTYTKPSIYFLSFLFNLENKYDETLNYKKIFEDSTASDIFSEGVIYHIGDALYYTGGIYRDMAVRFYKKANYFYQKNSIISLIFIYTENKEWEKADSLLNLLKNYSGDEYYYTAGYYFYKKRKMSKAEEYLKKLRKSREGFKNDALLLLAFIYERKNKYNEAILTFKNILRETKDKKIIGFILSKMLSLYILQQDEENIKRIIGDARRVLDVEGEDLNIYTGMLEQAIGFFLENQFEQAKKYAKEESYLIKSSAPLEKILYTRVLETVNQDSIKKVMKEIEEINPKSRYLPEIMFKYGVMVFDKNPKESYKIFKKLKTWYKPSDIEPLFEDIYYYSFHASFNIFNNSKKNQDLTQAIKEGESFVTFVPQEYKNYPDVLLFLSTLYIEKGNRTDEFLKKRAYFEKAYRLLTLLKDKFENSETYINNRKKIEKTIKNIDRFIRE